MSTGNDTINDDIDTGTYGDVHPETDNGTFYHDTDTNTNDDIVMMLILSVTIILMKILILPLWLGVNFKKLFFSIDLTAYMGAKLALPTLEHLF